MLQLQPSSMLWIRYVCLNSILPLFQNKSCVWTKIALRNKSYIWWIFLKLRQMNGNVAKNNVSVVANGLPSQIILYTCLTTDIWIRWRRRTLTWFYALWCHLPKMVGFQWNWHEKFSNLLWTPLARERGLVRDMQRMQFHAKSAKNDLKPTNFLKRNF